MEGMLLRRLAFHVLALALGGAGLAADPAADATRALPANLLPVPIVRQKTNYSCGDVATLALVRYWRGEDFDAVPESGLYAPLRTTEEDGTDPHPIEAFLDAQGLDADYETGASVDLGQLLAAVDRGQPPIVDLQAWQNEPRRPWAGDWDDGHYVVLVGWDDRDLFFMDPSTDDTYAFIPRQEFVSRWHDVVGKANVRTQHLVIFVHGDGSPRRSDRPPPPRATRID